MGQELDCTLRYRRRKLAGKAYLETDHVLFRGPERLKVLLKDLKGVSAAAGVLKLEFDTHIRSACVWKSGHWVWGRSRPGIKS